MSIGNALYDRAYLWNYNNNPEALAKFVLERLDQESKDRSRADSLINKTDIRELLDQSIIDKVSAVLCPKIFDPDKNEGNFGGPLKNVFDFTSGFLDVQNSKTVNWDKSVARDVANAAAKAAAAVTPATVSRIVPIFENYYSEVERHSGSKNYAPFPSAMNDYTKLVDAMNKSNMPKPQILEHSVSMMLSLTKLYTGQNNPSLDPRVASTLNALAIQVAALPASKERTRLVEGLIDAGQYNSDNKTAPGMNAAVEPLLKLEPSGDWNISQIAGFDSRNTEQTAARRMTLDSVKKVAEVQAYNGEVGNLAALVDTVNKYRPDLKGAFEPEMTKKLFDPEHVSITYNLAKTLEVFKIASENPKLNEGIPRGQVLQALHLIAGKGSEYGVENDLSELRKGLKNRPDLVALVDEAMGEKAKYIDKVRVGTPNDYAIMTYDQKNGLSYRNSGLNGGNTTDKGIYGPNGVERGYLTNYFQAVAKGEHNEPAWVQKQAAEALNHVDQIDKDLEPKIITVYIQHRH